MFTEKCRDDCGYPRVEVQKRARHRASTIQNKLNHSQYDYTDVPDYDISNVMNMKHTSRLLSYSQQMFLCLYWRYFYGLDFLSVDVNYTSAMAPTQNSWTNFKFEASNVV